VDSNNHLLIGLHGSSSGGISGSASNPSSGHASGISGQSSFLNVGHPNSHSGSVSRTSTTASDATFLSRSTVLPTVDMVFGDQLTGDESSSELLLRAFNYYLAPVNRNITTILIKLDELGARMKHLEDLVIPVLFMSEDSPQNKFGIIVAKSLLLKWQ